jgi:hypothetical protein
VRCTDLDPGTTFSFGPPQAITLSGPPPTAPVVFPRMEKTTSSLFFVYGANGQIAQAPQGATQGSWGMWSALPAPYNAASPAVQEGPFPLPDGKALAAILLGAATAMINPLDPVLLFGSGQGSANSLYVANLEMPPPASATPLSMTPFSPGDRSISVATDVVPPRFFWLRGGQVSTTTGPAVPVKSLTITYAMSGCVAKPGSIADPWVRPDGTRLLFSGTYYDGNPCMPTMTGAQSRLFYVDLDPATGDPTGDALPIFPLDTSDGDQTPSLSPDACLLLFSRSGVSGSTTIVEALRE